MIHRWNPRLPGNTYWSEPETSEFRRYQLSVTLPSIMHHHLRIAMLQLIATWALGLFSHVWYKEQKSDEESILLINTLHYIDQTHSFFKAVKSLKTCLCGVSILLSCSPLNKIWNNTTIIFT